ncbi:unnamed protein product [Polarella glacialis]|uniref:EF-hand domain-containing protein n=1 Tax=Polarella glacialis TaxID=89957 RepID=A0A813GPS5_POLGL|nr:unnamed protein product [Polarella glacialis]
MAIKPDKGVASTPMNMFAKEKGVVATPTNKKASITINQIKDKFAKLDRNGNGSLSFAEMATLLRSGGAELSDRDLKLLFSQLDTNSNGVIEFNEFVEYVFTEDRGGRVWQSGPPVRRSSKANAKWDDSAENLQIDWSIIKPVFIMYAKPVEDGFQMNGSAFRRLLTDHNMFCERLKPEDSDILFSKHRHPGHKHLGKDEFRSALRELCVRKRIPGCVLRAYLQKDEEKEAILAARKREEDLGSGFSNIERRVDSKLLPLEVLKENATHRFGQQGQQQGSADAAGGQEAQLQESADAAGGQEAQLQESADAAGGQEAQLQESADAAGGQEGQLQESADAAGGQEGQLQESADAAGGRERQLQEASDAVEKSEPLAVHSPAPSSRGLSEQPGSAASIHARRLPPTHWPGGLPPEKTQETPTTTTTTANT